MCKHYTTVLLTNTLYIFSVYKCVCVCVMLCTPYMRCGIKSKPSWWQCGVNL